MATKNMKCAMDAPYNRKRLFFFFSLMRASLHRQQRTAARIFCWKGTVQLSPQLSSGLTTFKKSRLETMRHLRLGDFMRKIKGG
jgi:hypothetical protein